MRRGDYYLTVKEVNLKKYTTLQINKDPGEQIVWFASVMLIAGIMIALFMPHKKLWLRLKKDKKNNVELTVGSTSNKNRAAFAGELESLVKSFEEIS
jgi:cytochrome c biogenesis protein